MWNSDKYSIPECLSLGEHYLKLDDTVLSSSENIYKRDGLDIQVRSTHKKAQ